MHYSTLPVHKPSAGNEVTGEGRALLNIEGASAAFPALNLKP